MLNLSEQTAQKNAQLHVVRKVESPLSLIPKMAQRAVTSGKNRICWLTQPDELAEVLPE